MYFSFQGVIAGNDPLLNTGIRYLDVAVLASGTYLFAGTGGSGGVTTFRLDANGSSAQRIDQAYFTESAWPYVGSVLATLTIDARSYAVVGGDAANDLLVYDVDPQGRLGNFDDIGNLPGGADHVTDAISVQASGRTVVYVADAGRGDVHWMVSNGAGALQTSGTGHINLDGAQDLATVDTSSGQFVLVTDRTTQDLISFAVDPATGALSEVARIGAATGLWFTDPTGLELVSAFGTTFAIVPAAGSHSLSVAQVTSDGTLIATDHLIDTRETRFGGAQSVAVAQSGDHVFVVTGGADDGVSLFKLLPNGRLVQLETLPHNTGGGLMNVSDIAATITGDTLQIFASSQNSGGVAQYHVSVANLGRTATTTGTAGDDILIATTGSATLSGGAGDDILVSTDGDVTLTGGNGADIFVITEAHSTTRITDFEDGQDRIDMSGFFFLRSPDQLNVSPTSNGALIRFRDSEIHVTARNGASLDSLAIFGAEFDHPDHLLLPVEVTPDADGRIIGTSGADTLIGTDDSDTITGGGADDEIDGRAGNDTLHGDDGNDQILGGAGDDILDGGLGQDSLDAGAGQDWIDGGDGNDTITAGTGDDQVLGSEGNDNIALGSGHDIAWGGAGDDSIIGDAGRDVINGGTGRDTLIGGDGQDDLWGDAENDLLIGNADDDALAGGDGRDRLEGEAGQDTLVGGAGQDTLEGGDGDDVLFGNSGNDFIKGGKGDDRIWAGSGDDELFGDDGADVFAFSLTSGDNIVFDFAPGQDRIQIYDRDLQYDYLNLAADGDDTHIDLGATSLRLVGVTPEQISAGDIIFGW